MQDQLDRLAPLGLGAMGQRHQDRRFELGSLFQWKMLLVICIGDVAEDGRPLVALAGHVTFETNPITRVFVYSKFEFWKLPICLSMFQFSCSGIETFQRSHTISFRMRSVATVVRSSILHENSNSYPCLRKLLFEAVTIKYIN